MKIAWVSSWPPRHCGIATYSLDLVKALRKEGHHIDIVCHTNNRKKGEKNVYPIMDIKKPDWEEKLYERVKKLKPDIVHLQHEYGLYAHNEDYGSSLLHTFFQWQVDNDFPVVITYHSVYAKLSRIESRFIDITLKLISAGIVHEKYQFEHLPWNIGRIPDNVYVIPHGATDVKAYPHAKKELGLDKGKKVVGMIGWWDFAKNFDRIVKLWPKILRKVGKNCILVIAGDSRPGIISGKRCKKKLLDQIKNSSVKKNIRVILGAFSPEEYNKVLASFDVTVLPYTQASQSGNLAHSFALGIPVIVSAIEGLKAEVENSGAGIAVRLGDDLELEHAIITLIKNDKLRERYRRKAKKYVRKKIKWSVIAKRHVKLYKELTKKRIIELKKEEL